MDTFLTSYRRDLRWPWSLPVKLTAWKPPERTFFRPREGPAPPCSDCPCPEHSWATQLGHYACLAAKEARLHQRSQATRAEIRRCLTRTEEAKRARRGKFPPLPGGEEWLTIYASDYTKKDSTVNELSYVDLLTELVSSGIPKAPLGSSLFHTYRDPTRFRESPHTVPLYDPNRPIAAREIPDIYEQWYLNFPADSEYTSSFSVTAYNTTKRCQPFKYPLRPQLPIG